MKKFSFFSNSSAYSQLVSSRTVCTAFLTGSVFLGGASLAMVQSTAASNEQQVFTDDPASSSLLDLSAPSEKLQSRMVKVYGAGGFAEMEEYQSGFFISQDGLIVTVFSSVLNADTLECVLFDGSRAEAKLLGVEPTLEIALLKIEKDGLPFFDIRQAAETVKDRTLDGLPVLALSNLFGVAVGNEPVSVQAGYIAVTTQLDASRRAFETQYRGDVYVLDVTTNNPGAAGGALVSADGERLYGILGKELQDAQTGCWLNFALPVSVLQQGIQNIQSGDAQTLAAMGRDARSRPERSLRLQELGVVMVPEITAKTPAFIDAVSENSRAARAGLKPDDLLLYWNGRLIQSLDELAAELEFTDWEDPVRVTLLRNGELLELDVP